MKKMYTSEKRNWISPALSAFALGAALLAAPAARAQVVTSTPKIEAESGVLSGGAVVATTIQPFSGTGYVDYNGSDSGVTLTYTAAAAGFHDIVIRYESQFDFKYGDLVVNGGPRSEVYFNSTKQGVAGVTNPTFRSTTPRRIMLNAGANTITIEKGYNYYGIDYIQVAPSSTTVSLTPAATTGRVEAEAGQIFAAQAVVKDGDASAHSGASYVSLFSNDKSVVSSITLPVNIATAGAYQIAVGARSLTEVGKTFDVTVTSGGVANPVVTTSVGAAATPNFTSYIVGKYVLAAGINNIVITSQTAYVEFDYADITATTISAARAGADAQKALAVYPNPATSQDLSVSLESATAQNASIELVNALGQRVLSTSRRLSAGANQFQLPTSRVAAGVYQLLVHSADQPVLSRRVMITE